MKTLPELIKDHNVWYCMDCGKCSSICPVTRWETRQHTSPRLLIEKSVQCSANEFMRDALIHSCLTCKLCTGVCPSDVQFSEFIRDIRQHAYNFKEATDCTHSGLIQTWGRMMTHSEMHQARLNWFCDDMQISPDGNTLFFVGCLPYFDTTFSKIGVEGIQVAQAAVRILNHLGIKPQIMADERCCGHDQLWDGEIETFQVLANLNLQALKSSKASRIVTTCPECARTLKLDYPRYAGDLNMEVLHLSELLAQNGFTIPADTNGEHPAQVTFQDPCRLGRHLGIYDAPRQVIEQLGIELIEMEHHHESSECCGTSCWRACGQMNKAIQVERLQEARATGAKTLVTACLKCQIHLKCAQNDTLLGEKLALEIKDLTTLVADHLIVHSPEQIKEVHVGSR